MRKLIVLLSLGLIAAVPAAAQNASTPGAIAFYATLNNVGVRLAYGGDANANATARLEWRPAGSATWNAGVAMTRITNQRWAGSVLWLTADTPYDIRATIDDPDGGGSVTGTIRTRAEVQAAPSLTAWWVATNGSDANPGTQNSPFATLQAAAAHVQPGDQIRVKAGVYSQTLDATVSGTAAQPIQLIADAPGVVLDGADPAYRNRGDWREDGGGIWSVPYTGTTRLVCADSLQRLYHQASLAALQTNANAMTQGWAAEGGRLYVKLEDLSSPAGHVMSVARYDIGIYLDVNYWIVSGFEVRHFGTTIAASGITLRGASHCVVSGNHSHTNGGKEIYLRVLAADNLIESNLCRDPRISGWPWAATKAHEEELQGISNRGGRGNVIRFNVARGTFDGIDSGGDTSTEDVAADTDIHDNLIDTVADDGLETESFGAINFRVYRNRVINPLNSMSIAPSIQGPEYVLFNTFSEYRKGGFKFSISSTGVTWICHNTIASSKTPTGPVYPTGPYSNMHFRNNILVGNGQPAVGDDAGESQTGNDFDGDLLKSDWANFFYWRGVPYGTLGAVQGALGFELNGRYGDPLFNAAASGDYTLRAGSPAIDAAIRLPGINDVWQGAAPDIGAFEFGAADVTPPAAIRDLTVD